jgi:hypothetical protein
MSFPFNYFDVSPSGRTPNLTKLHPHEPCSHCSSPYHSLGDCPYWEQFSNFSNEQLNTSFSSPRFESNANFYNPDWSNHSDFSWHDHATENFAPQVDELHHPEYPLFDNHFSSHSSHDYPPEKSSLEDTLKEFMELVGQPTIPVSHEPSIEDTLEAFKRTVKRTVNQPCQEIIDAPVANTEAVVRLEGQFGHLVAEFNLMEEGEFQSQELARSEEIFKETISEPSLEYSTLVVQTEEGEITEISFPNSFSLAAELYMLDNHFSLPSSSNRPSQESLVQHFPIAHIDDLEERANQLMVARHAHTQLSHTHTPHQSCEYCYHPSHQFDDCPFINHYMTEVNKFALDIAQTTTILVNEEIGDEVASECSLEDPKMEHFAPDKDDLDLDRLLDHADTFSEPSLEDLSGECFDQIENDMDLDNVLKQAVRFREPSLEDPLEESFAQFEFDLDLDMVHEQAKALLDPAPEMWTENGEEENLEQIVPPPILNWPNDKKVSTEAHFLITIPLET